MKLFTNKDPRQLDDWLRSYARSVVICAVFLAPFFSESLGCPDGSCDLVNLFVVSEDVQGVAWHKTRQTNTSRPFFQSTFKRCLKESSAHSKIGFFNLLGMPFWSSDKMKRYNDCIVSYTTCIDMYKVRWCEMEPSFIDWFSVLVWCITILVAYSFTHILFGSHAAMPIRQSTHARYCKW